MQQTRKVVITVVQYEPRRVQPKDGVGEATEAMESQMLVTESEDFRSYVSHKRKIFL